MWALLSALLLSAPASLHGLSCLDEAGKEVNWWFLLKHPKKDIESATTNDADGVAYVYMTSENSADGWQRGSKLVTDPQSLLGQELSGIYSGSVKNYLFYNDQLPNGSWTQEYGHSKGYLGWDDSTAFWVSHSIPHFPNYVAKGYLYGDKQEDYGQHAFCLSMTKQNVDEVAAVMKFSNGWIFENKTDGSLPNIEDVLRGKVEKDGTIVHDMQLPWGTVKLFGKTSDSEDNMLQKLITPTLELTVLSQSWLNGGGPFGSRCPPSGYDVLDIAELKLLDESHDTHKDHSKWAVAKLPSSKWACALDNNHVHEQLNRSGLAVCFEEAGLSTALRSAAIKVAPCDAPAPSPSPTPGSCCFYHDDTCTQGKRCCSRSGRGYRSSQSCERYGAKHHCHWTGSDCIVNGSHAVHDVVVVV